MILKKELRVLHLAENKKSTTNHIEGNLSRRDLKGSHTSSNEATSLKSATPFRGHFLLNFRTGIHHHVQILI